MPALPEKHLDRLDAESAKLKEAFWAYRFVRDELKLKIRAPNARGRIDSAELERLKTAAAAVAAAMRGFLAAEEEFRDACNSDANGR